MLSWWLTDHLLGGNGFIAAFVAGSVLRLSYENAQEQMDEFDGAWGDLLVYFVFFAFGVAEVDRQRLVPLRSFTLALEHFEVEVGVAR